MVRTEIRSTLLGAVLGIGVGLSTIVASGSSTFVASVTPGVQHGAYQKVDGSYAAKRRVLERKQLAERREKAREKAGLNAQKPTLKTHAVVTAPVVAPTAAPTPHLDCVTVSILRSQILEVASDDAVQAVLARAQETCGGKTAPAVEEVKKAGAAAKAIPVRVNNHCEKYAKDTQRYTRCVVNERNGQNYQGKQTHAAAPER